MVTITEMNLKKQLPYQRFFEAQKQLCNIEAIDYFFAKEMFNTLISKNKSASNFIVIFHLFIALSESLRKGHTCLDLNVIANSRFGFACDPDGIVNHHGFNFPDITDLNDCCSGLAISANDNQAIVLNKQKLFMRRYYQFEQEVKTFIDEKRTTESQLSELEQQNIKTCITALFPAVESVQAQDQLKEIDWQKVAVANALNKSFTIIAGGPGTGKTYTVTKLLAALISLNIATLNKTTPNDEELSIALVAPTGKAAQRLSESINQAIAGFSDLIPAAVLAQIPTKAQTIHRLLGVIPHSPNFRHHQDNLLTIDVLLIDEVSMVDLALMARILRALPKHCKVILLGDAEQLPSVAAGSVLADLAPYTQTIYSKGNCQYLSQVTSINSLKWGKKKLADHVTFLTKSRRFDDQGEIGRIAEMVIQGDSQQSWQLLQNSVDIGQQDKQLSQIHWLDPQYSLPDKNSWLTVFVERYYQPLMACIELSTAFNLLAKFRILAATRVGEYGVEQLNLTIEAMLVGERYQPHANSALTAPNIYHAKPIMINENDYILGLYNGDIGFIWKNEAGHLMAVFERIMEQGQGEYLWVLPSRLPSYETVYAMTIHKTQGSEFDHVAIVLPDQADYQLLSRELLYTGITRAKNKLTLHTNKAVWSQGVEARVKRNSGLNIS